MRRIATLAFLLALVTGCVGSKKYKALEASLAQEQEAHAAAVAESAELEAERDRLAAEVERLNGERLSLLSEKGSLEASVAEMEQALREMAERKAAADRAARVYYDLVERFQTLIDAGKLEVKIVDGRMVVQLATDILFGSGSATLSEDGASAIAEVGKVLADIPERRYQVEGHTDNVPIKSDRFPSNWELASARSLVVVKAMQDAGLAADRVSGASFADTKPIAPNETPEGRSANRRIEIVVVPDLSQLPGMEELEAAARAGPTPVPVPPAEPPAPAPPPPTP